MKRIAIVLTLVLALGVTAFVAVGGISRIDSLGLLGEERLVRSRVEGYWQARTEGDMEKMAEFVHPDQGAIFEAGMLVTDGYEIQDVVIEGDVAQAKLTVHSRLKHPVLSSRERTVEMNHKWVRYDGKWYADVLPVGIHELIKNYRGEWQPSTAQATQ